MPAGHTGPALQHRSHRWSVAATEPFVERHTQARSVRDAHIAIRVGLQWFGDDSLELAHLKRWRVLQQLEYSEFASDALRCR